MISPTVDYISKTVMFTDDVDSTFGGSTCAMDDQGRKSIFITGAGSGMGAATARRFAAEGWFVGCFDIDSRGLDQLKNQLGSEGRLYARLDVTDRVAYAAAVEAFGAETDGRMDLLHNNAGVIAQGAFDEMAWETVERIIAVNLFGVMIGVRTALPLLRQTPKALCFTTCSASAIFGSAGLAAYSASKHAVKGLTEALSVELAAYGVRVGDVLPGLIETAMVAPEQRSLMPKEGMWRLLPASAVADAVWDAYHDETQRLHRFVPSELAEYEQRAATDPDAVRDEILRRFSLR